MKEDGSPNSPRLSRLRRARAAAEIVLQCLSFLRPFLKGLFRISQRNLLGGTLFLMDLQRNFLPIDLKNSDGVRSAVPTLKELAMQTILTHLDCTCRDPFNISYLFIYFISGIFSRTYDHVRCWTLFVSSSLRSSSTSVFLAPCGFLQLTTKQLFDRLFISIGGAGRNSRGVQARDIPERDGTAPSYTFMVLFRCCLSSFRQSSSRISSALTLAIRFGRTIAGVDTAGSVLARPTRRRRSLLSPSLLLRFRLQSRSYRHGETPMSGAISGARRIARRRANSP